MHKDGIADSFRDLKNLGPVSQWGPIAEENFHLVPWGIAVGRKRYHDVPPDQIHDGAITGLLTGANDYVPSRGKVDLFLKLRIVSSVRTKANSYRRHKKEHSNQGDMGNYMDPVRRFDQMERNDMINHLRLIMGRVLTPNEQQVIVKHYGLDGQGAFELSELVGSIPGVESLSGVYFMHRRARQKLLDEVSESSDAYLGEAAAARKVALRSEKSTRGRPRVRIADDLTSIFNGYRVPEFA